MSERYKPGVPCLIVDDGYLEPESRQYLGMVVVLSYRTDGAVILDLGGIHVIRRVPGCWATRPSLTRLVRGTPIDLVWPESQLRPLDADGSTDEVRRRDENPNDLTEDNLLRILEER